MIVSMTGFGDASCERGGTHYAVEIRSLNNRFFKPVVKLPEQLVGMEPEIESMLRERLQRGSVTFVLKMRIESAEAAHRVNVAAVRAYLEQLAPLRKNDPGLTVDLAGLLMMPGVTSDPADQAAAVDRHGAVVRELTLKAVDRLLEMRSREGQASLADLLRHTEIITASLRDISARAPVVIEDYHRRLAVRVNQLLAKAELRIGEAELLKEVALFAERADISEEIQRLGQHVLSFEACCKGGEHAGRKLDFITQEMLREANTIGSKANDAPIARHIVDIKGAIDRLKEQVQNVE